MSTRYLIGNALISVKNTRNKGYDLSGVVVPYSSLTLAVLKKMEQYGYVKNVEQIEGDGKKNISAMVRFDRNGISLVRKVKLISKPGSRAYYNVDKIRHMYMRNKFNLIIISTSKGVLSASEALEQNIGGEVLCEVF